MAQFPLVVSLRHGSRSGVEYLRAPGRVGALTPAYHAQHQLGRVSPI